MRAITARLFAGNYCAAAMLLHAELTRTIIGAAMRVHSALGPGLMESVYEACLRRELQKAGLRCESQVWLPVVYDGEQIDVGYRIDLLVEGVIVIELKAVEQVLEVHKAQLISYLKLGNFPVGLLINFNVVHLRQGIRRFVNRQKSSASTASSL